MTENVSKAIENTEVNVTDIQMETEPEVSAGLAVSVIIGSACVLLATGVGLYKLGKRVHQYYKDRKASAETEEQSDNFDIDNIVEFDISQTVDE